MKPAVPTLILFYPALCIPDDARADQMMFAKFYPQQVPAQFRCGLMKLGSRYVTDVIHMDPYKEISGYSGRVLIVRGTANPIVCPDYSQKACETYRNRAPVDLAQPPRTEFLAIDGGNYGFSKMHDTLALGAAQQFLGRHFS